VSGLKHLSLRYIMPMYKGVPLSEVHNANVQGGGLCLRYMMPSLRYILPMYKGAPLSKIHNANVQGGGLCLRYRPGHGAWVQQSVHHCPAAVKTTPPIA